MKKLKLSELKEGEIYQCLLSGRKVLIASLYPGIDNVGAFGWSYNPVVGRIESHMIWDYSLTEINGK